MATRTVRSQVAKNFEGNRIKSYLGENTAQAFRRIEEETHAGIRKLRTAANSTQVD